MHSLEVGSLNGKLAHASWLGVSVLRCGTALALSLFLSTASKADNTQDARAVPPAIQQLEYLAVLRVKGTVHVTRNEETRPVRGSSGVDDYNTPVASVVLPGDTVSTGPDSYCDLITPTLGTLSIGPNSRLQLPLPDASKDKPKTATLQVLSGEAYVRVPPPKPRTKAVPFQLRTPVTVLAVKGTEFFAKCSPERETIGVLSGVVEVMLPELPPVVLRERQFSTVANNKAAAPLNFTQTEADSLGVFQRIAVTDNEIRNYRAKDDIVTQMYPGDWDAKEIAKAVKVSSSAGNLVFTWTMKNLRFNAPTVPFSRFFIPLPLKPFTDKQQPAAGIRFQVRSKGVRKVWFGFMGSNGFISPPDQLVGPDGTTVTMILNAWQVLEGNFTPAPHGDNLKVEKPPSIEIRVMHNNSGFDAQVANPELEISPIEALYLPK
jgi:hypothetical protein